MKVFPAIDIKDKKCVRLIKGDFSQKTDCLLYTSPSPRDPHLSRMPSSA